MHRELRSVKWVQRIRFLSLQRLRDGLLYVKHDAGTAAYDDDDDDDYNASFSG